MPTRKKAALSHVDKAGKIRMVDVGEKAVTDREAVAVGRVTVSREALRAIRSGNVKKGDPLQAARLAGIMAAKRTSELIPLCHPLPISHVDVEFTPEADGYSIQARVRTTAQTGVEMEALSAVSVAALTLYDMLKAIDKGMIIGGIGLLEKRGGRGGRCTMTDEPERPLTIKYAQAGEWWTATVQTPDGTFVGSGPTRALAQNMSATCFIAVLVTCEHHSRSRFRRTKTTCNFRRKPKRSRTCSCSRLRTAWRGINTWTA